MSHNQPALPTFESHDVAAAAVRITRCGDGLSEALRVQPKALDLGDYVSYVLTGKVAAIAHREKDGVVTRLHTIETETIAEVDRDTAEKMLQAAAEEVERRKAEIDGQLRLDEEQAAEAREEADRRESNTHVKA